MPSPWPRAQEALELRRRKEALLSDPKTRPAGLSLREIKQDILDTPRTLRETMEKGRPEFEALVRRVRWGEGRIYVLGCGSSLLTGLTGAYAFESLLGWPALVSPPAVFRAYTLPALRPRSVVLAISPEGDSEEELEAVRGARSRGAILLVMTCNPESSLAKVADGVFFIRSGAARGLGLSQAVSEQAAMCAVALITSKIFMRHDPKVDMIIKEFESLPDGIEWVLTYLIDAARSFASALGPLRNIRFVGGGFYHPVALRAALLFERIHALNVAGIEASEFRGGPVEMLGRDAAVVFLSGTRCRLKEEIHKAASRVREAGRKSLSVTDKDDRELSDRSSLALLLPLLSEMAGSTLTLALVGWIAYQAARERERGPGRSISSAGARGPND